MVPVSILLKGFLSYRKETYVDLTGVNLLGIIGRNGHGKSSWLDAVTFALFGETRYKDPMEVISEGSKEVLVEYVFDLSDKLFKVKRMKKARASKLAHHLDLYTKNNNGEWNSIGDAKSVTNTQKKILSILSIDHNTFINSAFLLQDEINSFTEMDASKRRKIFEEILGLRIYAEMKEMAIIDKRAVNRKIEGVLSDVEKLEEVIGQKKELAEQFEVLNTRLSELEKELEECEKELEKFSAVKSEVESKEISLNNLRERVLKKIDEREELSNKMKEISNSIAGKRSILANSEQILKSLNFFNDMKANLEAIADTKSQYDSLCLQKSMLNNKFNEETRPLLENIQNHRGELQTLEGALNIKEECSKRLEYFAQIQAEYDDIVNVKLPSITEDKNSLTANINEVNTGIMADENKVLELRQKYSKVQQFGGLCPLTDNNCPVLTEQNTAEMLESIKAEGITIEGTLGQRKAQVTAMEENFNALCMDESGLVSRRDAINNELFGKQVVERDYEKALEAENVIEVLRQNFNAETEEYDNNLREFNSKNEEFDASINALNYDATAHQNVQQQFDVMKSEEIEEKAKELESIQVEIKGTEEKEALYKEQLDKLNQEINEIDTQGRTIRNEIETQKKEMEGYEGYVETKKQHTASRDGVNIEIGGVQQKLKECEEADGKIKKLREKIKEEQDEVYALEELILACDLEKGIPAQIIEDVVPEVEVHANELLGQFGSNHRIEFTFEKKNKSNDKIKSDFDIRILTPGENPRSFEGYSGGQKVFISLAIRLGISYLLVKRASCRFEFLALDESFSALDETNKQVMIQVIHGLKERFKMIWIISHLEEIKQVSDVMLEVSMPSEEVGSQVKILT